MSALVPFSAAQAGQVAEQVLILGDLAALNHQERASYYVRICESLGLNPMTKPFEYLQLNGKLQLYALKACTDQLRSIHGVSVVQLTEAERDGVHIVTAILCDRHGRTDIGKGAVNIAGLKGDALANALMKAETKAKRRATLSLCGLGFLDETEIETIPACAKNHSTAVVPNDQAQVSEAPIAPVIAGPEKKKFSRPEYVVPPPSRRLKEDIAARSRQRPIGPSKPFLASQAGQFNELNPPPYDEIPEYAR